MLGADHHGYVGRMMAMCRAFGDEPGLQPGDPHRPDGQPRPRRRAVEMSKRAGAVITLEDLVDAIGVDAARYALARYSPDSTIDLDLDLWAQHTNDNPVCYVQYAHPAGVDLSQRPRLGVERGELKRSCSITSGSLLCSAPSGSFLAS